MSIDELIVIAAGLAGIVFTFWYFLMKKDEIVAVQDSVEILVKGGYRPGAIEVPAGKTTRITFLREDKNSCLEEVVLSDFKVRKYLPVGQNVQIAITPQKKGEYQFSCGMNMFHGKIIVT